LSHNTATPVENDEISRRLAATLAERSATLEDTAVFGRLSQRRIVVGQISADLNKHGASIHVQGCLE